MLPLGVSVRIRVGLHLGLGLSFMFRSFLPSLLYSRCALLSTVTSQVAYG